jgi:hypothetical protein
MENNQKSSREEDCLRQFFKSASFLLTIMSSKERSHFLHFTLPIYHRLKNGMDKNKGQASQSQTDILGLSNLNG